MRGRERACRFCGLVRWRAEGDRDLDCPRRWQNKARRVLLKGVRAVERWVQGPLAW